MARPIGDELLRGKLVYLKRMQSEDAPLVVGWMSSMDYARHLMRRMAYPSTVEEMQGWIREADANEPLFAVCLTDDDRLVGFCGFKDVRWASRHALFAVGIGESAMRGRGYGTEATELLLRYAFLEMNLNCVALEVFSFNAPAIAVYQKLGFKLDGTMRAYLYRDGEYHDMHLMSLLQSEWFARYRGAE